MKLDLKEFLPKLILANMVVNPKPVIQVMGCFLLHTKDGLLYVNASDSENTISIPVKPLEYSEMNICVNAGDFYSALSNLKGEEIEIVMNEEKKLIRCSYKSGYFQLPYEDDLTAAQALEIQTDAYSIDKDISDTILLSEAIEKAEIATAEDNLKPIFCGVYFDFKQDGMITVATNANKMSRFKTDIKFPEDTKGFIMPNKAANILVSLLKECDLVKMKAGERSVLFSSEAFTFTSRLTEGEYPNYNMLIPTDHTLKATANKNVLLNAIRRVSPMENNESGMLKLTFGTNSIIVEAEDIFYKKKAKEKVDVLYTGEPMEIRLNSKNMMALVQAIDNDEVEITFKNPRMPVVIRPKSDIDQLTMLVMPMVC